MMKKTHSRASIAKTLAEKCGVSRTEAKSLLDEILEQISQSLADGEDVKLSMFGSFRVRQKPQRPGRNPKTLEPVNIMPRRSISFKPSDRMKSRIQNAPNINS